MVANSNERESLFFPDAVSGIQHDHSGFHCPACDAKRLRMKADLRRWDAARTVHVGGGDSDSSALKCSGGTAQPRSFTLRFRIKLQEPQA